MPKLQIPEPSEKQWVFLRAKQKYVCFGGARAGGKSWALRVKAILLCLEYPGIVVCIIRKSYPELTKKHIRPIKKMLRCGRPDQLARYNDKEKALTFQNGSMILFSYLDTQRDMDRFQGTEADVFFLDEATQQPEEYWGDIVACLRAPNEFPKRIYLTCNPGGVGHAWVKRLFIDRRFNENENPEEYVFIQSLVTDNKALMRAQPDYYNQLLSLPPKKRKAWLYGDWNVYEGQIFEDFREEPDMVAAEEAGVDLTADEMKRERRFTHVIEPFEIPKDWTICRSFDWGYAKPFSVAWWAVDYNGVVYRILELYGCTETPNEGVKWTPAQLFAEVQRIENEHRWLKGKKIRGVADPAIWDAQFGESIAETAMKYGVFFEKGDHERLPGWMQIHYRFMFDEQGLPMMYIFSNCRAFIRTIPTLQYDEHKPEDLDTDGEDHVADEVRYFLMSRPIRPRAKKAPSRYAENPMNLFLDIKEDELMPAGKTPRLEIMRDADI